MSCLVHGIYRAFEALTAVEHDDASIRGFFQFCHDIGAVSRKITGPVGLEHYSPDWRLQERPNLNS